MIVLAGTVPAEIALAEAGSDAGILRSRSHQIKSFVVMLPISEADGPP
jgi:hypothetical protein